MDQLNIVDPDGIYRTDKYLKYGISQCKLKNNTIAKIVFEDSNRTYSENVKNTNFEIEKLHNIELTENNEEMLLNNKKELEFFEYPFLQNLNNLKTCLAN